MKISEIYKKYKIMPNLQEHMLRVTGVAVIIADNFKVKTDKNIIISTGLLHDLGNMAKIKIENFPEFAEPLGAAYWEKILNKFKQKYGNDDYTATYTILKELAVHQNIYDNIKALEFAKSPETAEGNNLELKICLYSDARVSPHGVVSLPTRLGEVKDRYMKNKGVSEERFYQISASLYNIEKQIFGNCKIKPEDISEEIVKPLFKDLLIFNISANNDL